MQWNFWISSAYAHAHVLTRPRGTLLKLAFHMFVSESPHKQRMRMLPSMPCQISNPKRSRCVPKTFCCPLRSLVTIIVVHLKVDSDRWGRRAKISTLRNYVMRSLKVSAFAAKWVHSRFRFLAMWISYILSALEPFKQNTYLGGRNCGC